MRMDIAGWKQQAAAYKDVPLGLYCVIAGDAQNDKVDSQLMSTRGLQKRD